MTVLSFPDQGPEYLGSVALYRDRNGRVSGVLTDMPAPVIERTGNEVPDRMRIIAGWVGEAASSMTVLAASLDLSANEEGNHD